LEKVEGNRGGIEMADNATTMTNPAERLVVITGGPGSGKTTLIAALQARGYATSPEAGRAIIRDQVEIGGNALPWSEPRAFAEQMLCWDMRSHRMALATGAMTFFDRGIPDVVGYLRLLSLAVPPHMERAAELFRYDRRVFIAPPWTDIFESDTERKQTFAEAVSTYEAMMQTYAACGYELIALPMATVAERVEFIERHLG
jgi:predicted ATPase